MKNAKTKPIEVELAETVVETSDGKSAALKKKKKTKSVDETPEVAPKVKKAKAEKSTKEEEPKKQKAPKDDKLTKFLVSMKKSVRKSIKKEAAEAGISMNEYIVLAVQDKLKVDTTV
jgi:predicted HicB family RNase H-like nuclease